MNPADLYGLNRHDRRAWKRRAHKVHKAMLAREAATPICERCGATMASAPKRCTEPRGGSCPGGRAYDRLLAAALCAAGLAKPQPPAIATPTAPDAPLVSFVAHQPSHPGTAP